VRAPLQADAQQHSISGHIVELSLEQQVIQDRKKDASRVYIKMMV
jgi:hypothetical protein